MELQMDKWRIETNRTQISRITNDDLHAIKDVWNGGFCECQQEKDLRRWLVLNTYFYAHFGYGTYKIETISTKSVVGFTGFIPPFKHLYPKFVIYISPLCRKMGLGAEVLTAMLPYGNNLSIRELLLDISPDYVDFSRLAKVFGLHVVAKIDNVSDSSPEGYLFTYKKSNSFLHILKSFTMNLNFLTLWVTIVQD